MGRKNNNIKKAFKIMKALDEVGAQRGSLILGGGGGGGWAGGGGGGTYRPCASSWRSGGGCGSSR